MAASKRFLDRIEIIVTDTGPKKKFATGLCVPFVDISLSASFYSASYFSKEIRLQEVVWLLISLN